MPSAFNRAETRNIAESTRLHQLIANLQLINNGARFPSGWLSVTGGLSGRNIERIKRANSARKASPANYTKDKLQEKMANLANKTLIRRWMYGYVRKTGANWVKKTKNGVWVPRHLPEWEVSSFSHPGHGRAFIKGGKPGALARTVKSGPWRNVLTAEGLLKPVVHTARQKPSPTKRSEPHLPTLRELAWKATPMSTMTNEQLKFMSQMTPMNLMMLKPKKRAQPLSANNLTESRREVAARRIGRAAKKYLAARPGRGQGPSPRSPRTLARQTNLGIMGGRRRSPGAANNTRITWSRNANGKINRFKTLENINMRLTTAQRNALLEMSENKAMNYLRNLARQR
jgi:hypothetical protein